MKLRLRINGKMLLYILGVIALIYTGSFGYISYKLYNISSENATANTHKETFKYASIAKRTLNEYVESLATINSLFSNFKHIPENKRRTYFMSIMHESLEQNHSFLSVWTIWEPNTIDSLDSTQIGLPGNTYIGSFSPGYYKDGGEIILEKNSSTELFAQDYFTKAKDCRCDLLLEPYYYSYTDSKADEILQTNVIAPIINEGKFYGVVGIDAPLSIFQEKFKEFKPMGDGQIYIFSNEGVFISCPDTNQINKSINVLDSVMVQKHNILERIADGESFEFYDVNSLLGEECLFAFEPLFVGNIKTPWTCCVSIPTDTIFQKANKSFRITLVIGLLGLLFLTIVIALIARSISRPIIRITNALKELAKGNIDAKGKVTCTVNDEIRDLADTINELYDGLNSASDFATEIGKGNLEAEYELLSAKDELGNSLLDMQASLVKANDEEEKKKKEDANRNWVTNGLAKFGEVIRRDNDDMTKFSENVINELIAYLDVAQGAVFIGEETDYDNQNSDLFVLKAAIAYGKPVMLTKSVTRGQELLGRAVDENKIIYLQNIPQEYVEISPGMQNEERPTNLVISPLTINEITYGVLEILSYDSFLEHQLEFIEKLSENIASVISSVKTNLSTAKLLEQSRDQADELAQHEEEMRQNLEEMQATQEEAGKRESDLSSYIKTLKKSMMIAELDINGRVLDMSPSLLMVHGVTLDTIQGKYYDAFIAQDEKLREKFNDFWESLIKNGKGKRNQIIKHRNKEQILAEEYMVIEQDRIQPKILLITIDRTKEKEINTRLKEAIEANK